MTINTKYDINYEQLYLIVTPIVTVSQFHQKIPNLSKNAAIFPNSAGTGPFSKMTKKIAGQVPFQIGSGSKCGKQAFKQLVQNKRFLVISETRFL